MPDMPAGGPPAAAAPAPAAGGEAGGLDSMTCEQLITIATNALAIASQKCVDEYAGAGDAAARIQQLTEEAAGAAAQALQEIQSMSAAPAGAPAPPAPPAPPEG